MQQAESNVEEGLTWLHVAVEVAMLVHVLEPEQDLIHPQFNLGFSEAPALPPLHDLVQVVVLQQHRCSLVAAKLAFLMLLQVKTDVMPTRYSKMKNSSLFSRITSLSLTMQGWLSFLRLLTSRRDMHSSQEANFRFMRFMATYRESRISTSSVYDACSLLVTAITLPRERCSVPLRRSAC